jgi:hypothetical protein
LKLLRTNPLLIGAIAVSGAPGADKNAACVEAGLTKVADKLK